MTEKLFELNSYLDEFECKVIELYEDGGNLCVVTDRSAFFPEGGGQTSDRGYFGDIFVKDVQEMRGKTVHIVENCEENVQKLQVGTVLSGKIDMKKRFSDMQQHSGEHIFSGIVHSFYGYDNVGFHLGSEAVTLDFNGELNHDDICKVEQLVNKAVWDNLKIRVFFPEREELEKLAYRSKKEIDGRLRLVEIPGVDLCACCAPHVDRTGEIGTVIVTAFERFRGGTRVSILCGERAVADIRKKLDENHAAAALFSAKETETFSVAQRVKNELSALSAELHAARLEVLRLTAEKCAGGKRVIEFCCFDNSDSPRELADLLSEKAEDFAAVLNGTDSEYRYVIISKSGFDLNGLDKKLNAEFSGRGGGRNGIVQGSVRGSEDEIARLLQQY